MKEKLYLSFFLVFDVHLGISIYPELINFILCLNGMSMVVLVFKQEKFFDYFNCLEITLTNHFVFGLYVIVFTIFSILMATTSLIVPLFLYDISNNIYRYILNLLLFTLQLFYLLSY